VVNTKVASRGQDCFGYYGALPVVVESEKIEKDIIPGEIIPDFIRGWKVMRWRSSKIAPWPWSRCSLVNSERKAGVV
jgi:hypothetical protein